MKTIDKERKLNKLFKETKLKLVENSVNEKIILIDFAKEYNKIWREDE